METHKILTLCLALKESQVLLGMKKRGFGAGRWNGFGGKLNPSESIEDAARREMFEECGVKITEMEEVGIHEFRFQNKLDEVLEVHVFRILSFEGEPVETDEMRPQWFSIDELPFDSMWPDDRYWFPYFLAGKKFRTKFLFGVEDRILKKEIMEVESL